MFFMTQVFQGVMWNSLGNGFGLLTTIMVNLKSFFSLVALDQVCKMTILVVGNHFETSRINAKLCEDGTRMRYSLCFKIKVTFGHKLRYEIKVTCGEISFKLCQTNWNVAMINVNVVVDELSSQITCYTCLTKDIWTRRHRRTSIQFYALRCHLPKVAGFQWKWAQKAFHFVRDTPSLPVNT